MADERVKKKRVAHIGNLGSGKTATILHSDDRLEEADCNLVYDIMKSMNKSQNVMSFQEFQNSRSKENKISRTNSDQNGKSLSSKQIKKFVPERQFPLMAKCQKSMKYLNKNRCIPKPRAHVGFIPRPPQKPISGLKSYDVHNNDSVSNNKGNCNESALKLKQKSKKNRHSPEINVKAKKPKISKSLDDSNDRNDSLITHSYGDTESDHEFEQFIQKHQPKKCKSKNNSTTSQRKIKKGNYTKKKKHREFICVKKTGKISQRALSDSEESSESQAECCETNLKKDDTSNEQIPSRSFQRIISNKNSNDSESDTYVMDSGTLNYDSSDSSEDENNLETESSINKCEYSAHLDDSKMSDIHRTEISSTFSNSLCDKATLCYDTLKLKCKIPCYVIINRDPLLDQKATSLHSDKLTVVSMVPVSSLDDDDDCVIISEEVNRSSSSDASTVASNPTSISEVITDKNDIQNKNVYNEKSICNSDVLRPQIGTNSEFSNEKLTDISDRVKDMPFEVQKDGKEYPRNVTSNESFSDTGNCLPSEKSVANKTTSHSHENVNSPECEEKSAISQHSSNYDKETSAKDKNSFNVQILSVKSLGESDIIVLSDDEEEKENKIIRTVNETEAAADDSDVEIICLDSSVTNEEKSETGNVGIISNNKLIEGNSSIDKNSIGASDLNDEDIIILDDEGVSNESSSEKNADEVHQCSNMHGKAIDVTNGLNSNKKEETTTLSDEAPDSNYNNGLNSNKREETISDEAAKSNFNILRILDTIDFDSIRKVLAETTVPSNKEDKKSESLPIKSENSVRENNDTLDITADSVPEKLKQNQSVASIGSSEVNYETKTSLIDAQDNKMFKNSSVLPNVLKKDSENVPNPVSISSSSSQNDITPKLSVSEKVIPSNFKTEVNTRNNQLLPRRAKMESDESDTDMLDIMAAESLKGLDDKQIEVITPLLKLYKADYRKLVEIKSTEENVTAGLKLLLENQTRKLIRVASAIKSVAKADFCFHKMENDFERDEIELSKSSAIKIDEAKNTEYVTQPSSSSRSDIEEDKVRILHPSIVERTTEVLSPSSSREIYNHLINSVCAECGKKAMAACSGCAKVYYCSEKCGMSYWSKGHFSTCRS